MVLGFILIVLAVVIVVLKKRSAEKAKEQEKKTQRAEANYIAAKAKLRDNKIMKLAVETTVTHIAELRKKAGTVELSEDTHHFYIADITKKYLSFKSGLKKGQRPHVSPSEDYHYVQYSNWLFSLDYVLSVSYESEGYESMNEFSLGLFLEVFAEELKKAGCPTWNEEYNSEERVGTDTLLIWDLTQYHPKKELSSFV